MDGEEAGIERTETTTGMKEPTRGPIFAALYQGMCDVARSHGYALAVHGSVVTDFDLIAVPWTDGAAEPERLYLAMKEYLNGMNYNEMLAGIARLEADDRKQIPQEPPTQKPHGRLAWNIYLGHGSKIDLSVMPRAITLD